MDLGLEIARKVNDLPPDLQARVLGFVASISQDAPVGQPGSSLCHFANTLDSRSAQEMRQAIEEN